MRIVVNAELTSVTGRKSALNAGLCRVRSSKALFTIATAIAIAILIVVQRAAQELMNISEDDGRYVILSSPPPGDLF